MGVLRILSSKISDATADGIAWLTGSVGPSDVVQVANLDTANNPPALDEDGNLNAVVLVRKDTSANLAGIVLKDGELAVVENGSGLPIGLRAGDGATAGGTAVGSRSGSIELGTTNISSIAMDTDSLVSGVSIDVEAGDVVTIHFQMNVRVFAFGAVTKPEVRLLWRAFNVGGSFVDYCAVDGSIAHWVTGTVGLINVPVSSRAMVPYTILNDYTGTAVHTYLVIGTVTHKAAEAGSIKLDAWKSVDPSTTPTIQNFKAFWSKQ